MNRKQKKELREHQSTRQLMGIGQITERGVKTAKGELVFFLVRPDNLSVLSPEGVQGRVSALADMLRATPNLRMLALDSRESFQDNKLYYQRRLEEETVPAIRDLLRQDMAHLDEIQSSTASAREFALVYLVAASSTSFASPQAAKLSRSAAAPLPTRTASLGSRGGPDTPADPRQLEKRLRDRGFHVRMAGEQDIKRLLGVYYQQDVTTERFPDFDGEEVAGNG